MRHRLGNVPRLPSEGPCLPEDIYPTVFDCLIKLGIVLRRVERNELAEERNERSTERDCAPDDEVGQTLRPGYGGGPSANPKAYQGRAREPIVVSFDLDRMVWLGLFGPRLPGDRRC